MCPNSSTVRPREGLPFIHNHLNVVIAVKNSNLWETPLVYSVVMGAGPLVPHSSFILYLDLSLCIGREIGVHEDAAEKNKRPSIRIRVRVGNFGSAGNDFHLGLFPHWIGPFPQIEQSLLQGVKEPAGLHMHFAVGTRTREPNWTWAVIQNQFSVKVDGVSSVWLPVRDDCRRDSYNGHIPRWKFIARVTMIGEKERTEKEVGGGGGRPNKSAEQVLRIKCWTSVLKICQFQVRKKKSIRRRSLISLLWISFTPKAPLATL